MTKLAIVRNDMGGTSLPAFDPDREGPLQPFEERQLKNLIQQLVGTPPRIRRAFLEHIKELDLN